MSVWVAYGDDLTFKLADTRWLPFGKRDVIATSDGRVIMKESSFDVLKSIVMVFIAFSVMEEGVSNRPQSKQITYPFYHHSL